MARLVGRKQTQTASVSELARDFSDQLVLQPPAKALAYRCSRLTPWFSNAPQPPSSLLGNHGTSFFSAHFASGISCKSHAGAAPTRLTYQRGPQNRASRRSLGRRPTRCNPPTGPPCSLEPPKLSLKMHDASVQLPSAVVDLSPANKSCLPTGAAINRRLPCFFFFAFPPSSPLAQQQPAIYPLPSDNDKFPSPSRTQQLSRPQKRIHPLRNSPGPAACCAIRGHLLPTKGVLASTHTTPPCTPPSCNPK